MINAWIKVIEIRFCFYALVDGLGFATRFWPTILSLRGGSNCFYALVDGLGFATEGK